MIREIYNRFFKKINDFEIDRTSELNISGRSKLKNCTIVCTDNSKIIIEDDCEIVGGTIKVSGNSTLKIGSKSFVRNLYLTALNEAELELEDSCIINYVFYDIPVCIDVNSGKFRMKSHSKLTGCKLYCRFSSQFTLGQYAGIGQRSEIVCDERIDIGDFALIAEEVCIYDTNSHSFSIEQRRKEIVKSFPRGLWDKAKPTTAPVFIGNDVWIGKGSTVTKGAYLSSGTIVGIRTNIGGFKTGDFPATIISSKPRELNR